MKTLSIVFLACCFHTALYAQHEKRMKAEVKSAIVFLQKAQVTSEVRTEVEPGMSKVVITGVPSDLNPYQIQVKGKGEAVIVATAFRQRSYENTIKIKEIHVLEDSVEHVRFEIDSLMNMSEVLKGEEQLLYANKDIKSVEKGVKAHDLEDVADLFRERLSALRAIILKNANKRDKLLLKYESLKIKLQNVKNLNGEIVISLQADIKSPVVLEINYLVENAGWEPLYELKSKTGNSNLNLIYKANVYQNTGANWDNIRLTLSSANPSLGANQPDFVSQKLSISKPIQLAMGYSEQDTKEKARLSFAPGAAASVNIRGVGSINGSQPLYVVDGELIDGDLSKVVNPNDIEYMEVLKDPQSIASYGPSGSNGVVLVTTKSKKYLNLSEMNEPSTQNEEKMVSISYELKNHVSLPSTTEPNAIIIKNQSIPSSFRHFSYPKFETDVFTNALITDWEKYNIINGNITIVTDDEFVATAFLDTKIVSDTLKLPLGRDKKVIVTRERIKDFTSKKFIGTSIRQEFGYMITLRNTNKEAINLTLIDQLPVSSDSQIEVEFENDTKAIYDPSTGKLTWDFHIDPTETKKVIFKYAVKYPKDKVVSGL